MDMASDVPKAFISHASEDKDRFVLDFATQLRARGVDAWLDKWEMAGGDSLIDRIFEVGIGQAGAVIVVLSHVSVTKRWVREELDAAVVKRIQDRTRLIPVLLDDVQVPVAIAALLHYDVPQMGIEGVVDGIVRTLFGVSDKPPLGDPPAYIQRSTTARPMGDAVDQVVFEAIRRKLYEAPANMLMFSNEIQDEVEKQGVSKDAFFESLEALNTSHLVHVVPMAGRQRYQIKGIPDHVWLDEEERRGLDIDDLRRKMLSEIVNRGDSSQLIRWDDFEGANVRTVLAILQGFEDQGLLTVHRMMRRVIVMNVSPLARRALREMG